MSRTVERRRGHDNWEPVEFMELTRWQARDRPEGPQRWIAAGKPYVNKDGIPTKAK